MAQSLQPMTEIQFQVNKVLGAHKVSFRLWLNLSFCNSVIARATIYRTRLRNRSIFRYFTIYVFPQNHGINIVMV